MHRDPDRSWITDSNSDHPKGMHRTKAGKLPRSQHCQPNENQRLQSVMRTLSLATMKRRSIWRKHKRQKTHLRKEHQTALTALTASASALDEGSLFAFFGRNSDRFSSIALQFGLGRDITKRYKKYQSSCSSSADFIMTHFSFHDTADKGSLFDLEKIKTRS